MARRKKHPEGSFAQLAAGAGLIVLALVLHKAGVFNTLSRMLVNHAQSGMQKVTDHQRKQIEARQKELIRERAEREAAISRAWK